MPWITVTEPYARPPQLREPPSRPPWDGQLGSDPDHGLLENAMVDRRVVGADAPSVLELIECSLAGDALTVGPATRLIVKDCLVSGCDLSQARLAVVHRSRFVDCKFTGADLAAASVRDVSFEQCMLQLANLRFATITRTAWTGCRLDEADFTGATLDEVATDGSTLAGVVTDHITCRRFDLRRAVQFTPSTVTTLAGCLFTVEQITGLAPMLALGLGIGIEALLESGELREEASEGR